VYIKMAEEYKPVTAQVKADTVGARASDEEKKFAAENGVVDAAFVDYDKALENYESRSDVETLADRRARENGTAFSEANFRREIGGVEDTGVVTTDVATDKEPKATKAEGTKK
jgi:hypothetical protein